jgi:hypothetical protein
VLVNKGYCCLEVLLLRTRGPRLATEAHDNSGANNKFFKNSSELYYPLWGYKSAILALVIAATEVLVVTSSSVDVVAKVESGKELDKIRHPEIRSGQECDTNQVGLQDNTTNTAMSE